jgi:catechol 2,3-dioxygenase-like lactoylglutathione lyase family enzyme
MSCVHHVSLGTNDYPKARVFYDAVMAALGLPLQMEVPGLAAAWGREHPEFWITTPHDAAPTTPLNTTPPSLATRTETRSRRCSGM